MKDVAHKTLSGVVWSALDKFGSQAVSFLVSMVLARLLDAKDFGIIAMATAFFSVAKAIIVSGLKDSLIQKQDTTNEDYSTVFFFNLMVSLAMYGLLFAASPFLASYFEQPALTAVIRYVGLILVIDSLAIVQTSILVKQLAFRRQVKIRFPAVLIGAVLGLALAFYYRTYWALVVQEISESLFFCIFIWVGSPWRPTLRFNKSVMRYHLGFGYKLLLSSIIGGLYKNIYAFVIGKQFGSVFVAYYNRADSFRVLIQSNTVALVQGVSYPIMASLSDDAQLKHFYRNILSTTLLVIMPIFVLLFGLAEEVILILFGEKWIEVAPALRIISVTCLLYPFNSINVNILKVKRKSGLFLRLEVIKQVILIVLIVAMIPFGFYYVVLTNLLMAVVSLFMNNYFSSSLLKYTLVEQLKDGLPLFGSGMLMLAFLLTADHFVDMAPLWQAMLVGGASCLVYLAGAWLLMPRKIRSLVDLVKSKIFRKKK